VNQSLRGYAPQDDWGQTQPIAGTRIDPVLSFTSDSFGIRSDVGVTGGTDCQTGTTFSVQWAVTWSSRFNGVRLFTRSDDGSRMWIDINHDGAFNSTGSEFVNNNWGNGQGTTTGPASVALAAGTYWIRIQSKKGAAAIACPWRGTMRAAGHRGWILPQSCRRGCQRSAELRRDPRCPRPSTSPQRRGHPATLTTSTFRVRYLT